MTTAGQLAPRSLFRAIANCAVARQQAPRCQGRADCATLRPSASTRAQTFGNRRLSAASGRRHQHQRRAMESREMAVGLQAPHFELPEPLTGKTVSLDDSAGAQAILIMFICNHCPFVIHLERAIVEMMEHFKPKGLQSFAISANSIVTHPQDAPEKMAEKAKALGYPFPYLYDESQAVAKAYGAVCTPEFYIFDAERRLSYHGRFDESTPRNGKPITGDDLRGALEDVLAGRPVQRPMRNSIGCGIKWHPA